MYYVVESNKSFTQAATDIESTIIRNGFRVLHVHDLATTPRAKDKSFSAE
ncbi:MAG: hypothetical protein SFU55_09890 [Methylophilus sp.]|nr:hypothetical protein [Methylophilus sp.]